jgi:hypothetical protein
MAVTADVLAIGAQQSGRGFWRGQEFNYRGHHYDVVAVQVTLDPAVMARYPNAVKLRRMAEVERMLYCTRRNARPGSQAIYSVVQFDTGELGKVRQITRANGLPK